MIDHLRKILKVKFVCQPVVIRMPVLCQFLGEPGLSGHLDDKWSLRGHFLVQSCLGVWIQWCEQVRGDYETEEGPSLLCSVLLC